MFTAKNMQSVITAIAEKHEIDLKVPGSHLKLVNEPYMALSINVLTENLVSVAHYYEQNSDLVSDPDMVFFTGYSEWVPVYYQDYRKFDEASFLSADGTKIEKFSPYQQHSQASFSRTWATNLRQQGFLKVKTDKQIAKETERAEKKAFKEMAKACKEAKNVQIDVTVKIETSEPVTA